MQYNLITQDYLVHYGVKGMKWGVRHEPYHNKNGNLSKAGYKKYYTNGRINKKGMKARNKGKAYQRIGKNPGREFAKAAGLGALRYAVNDKKAMNFVHAMGNVAITMMHAKGYSYGARKATAGAFIAAMGGILYSDIAPAAKTAYVGVRYNYDKQYKKRVDTLAGLKQYEKRQRTGNKK